MFGSFFLSGKIVERPNLQNWVEFLVYSSERVLCVDTWPYVLSNQA